MLTMKSLPNFGTSLSNYQSHRNKASFAQSPNCFILFRQSSRPCLFYSNFDVSCSRIGPSALLVKTTEAATNMDVNAKICKFCKKGNLKVAVDLLIRSEKSELELATYCSIVQLCAERKSLQDGKRVHLFITSNGIGIQGILGAKLVFMYVHCGDLIEGRRIFDQILNDKVFLWNLMMNEYAKIGKHGESIYLFKKMQNLGIEGNSHTSSCIMKCFAALGQLGDCETAHGYVFKSGFASHNVVANTLIAAYFKCTVVESAHKVFDELCDRDVISWNSMISGYVQNDLSETGLEVFIQMLISGVKVDSATMVSVLAASANIGKLSLGRAFHGYGVKSCSVREIMFSNTLLDMYSKCGDLDDAIRVFKRMGEKTIVSWTSMIAAYVRGGLYDDAIQLLDEMKNEHVKPDSYVLTSSINACACSGSLGKGREIHSYIKKNIGLDIALSNALMDMYAICGNMEEAQLIFSEIPVKNVVSWNTMIRGFSKSSLPNKALRLFAEMQTESRPDDTTISSILPACGSLAALDRGREIHGHALRNGYSSYPHVSNALLDMYVKCGSLVLAQVLFDMIPKKDLVSWTVMIAGYGMHGFGNEAIATFKEMKSSGIEPDEISFTSILSACRHSGLVNEGWKFFNSMKNECNIEPKLEHYACMVDLLARTGKLSHAYQLIKKMPIKPDAAIWGALLSGCKIHHDVNLAEKAAEHVFKLEPENTGYYVLLANIYAEAEKWEKVNKLRERIGKRGLKKSQGSSWIEIKGKFHIFVAGHSSHPEAKRIDLLLKKLVKMKDEGYYPNMKYALINASDMEKEVALCGHSEKLAMAFGVLNLPPGRTIRVTKNQRVCGDCHEMAKFMSTTTKREIVLRDSNRFHHFKEGICSCRGFW